MDNTIEKFRYDSSNPFILELFTKWYVSKIINQEVIPCTSLFANTSFAGGSNGVVLYRNENLQVQLWITSPNTIIVDHKHPNVDSYEVYFGGDIDFYTWENGVKSSKKVAREYFLLADDQQYELFKKYVGLTLKRVKPYTLHGGETSNIGGAFLSVQHWTNGIKPTSVEKDWEGEPLDNKHVILTPEVAM